MSDGEWSKNSVVAYALWTVAGMLLVASWLVWDDMLATHLGRTASLIGLAAVTATVRSYVVTSNATVRAAFRLGRDGRDAVTSLR